VHPLLRGRDVTAWDATASSHILLPHAADDLRNAIPEEELQSRVPATYDYLNEFRVELEARKELQRWGGASYSLFRIRPYTLNCWRVVWPHSSGANLRVAVLPPTDRTVPDQKLVLVPCESGDTAYFIAAVLNSQLLRNLIASSSTLDASPNLTKRIPLPLFDP